MAWAPPAAPNMPPPACGAPNAVLVEPNAGVGLAAPKAGAEAWPKEGVLIPPPKPDGAAAPKPGVDVVAPKAGVDCHTVGEAKAETR